MSEYDTAARAIAGKVVMDDIKHNIDELKIRLLHHMRTGDRIVGEHEGVRLGAITKCEGRKRAVVVDDAAFLKYVQANHPDEVYFAVREAFRERLLQQMLHDGCDLRTGVVVPGVEVREGEPYLMIKPTPEGREWVQTQLGGISRALESP